MKVSQKAVSIIFLFLMTVVLLAVLAFYYFSLENIVGKSSDCAPVESASVVSEKLYLNHDVLDLDLLCEADVKWAAMGGVEYGDGECIYTEGTHYGSYIQELEETDLEINKILLSNDLDYRISLDDSMGIFNDIMARYNKNHNYLLEAAEAENRELRLQNFNIQGIFDRKETNIVYILASMDEYLVWGENETALSEVPASASAMLLYKYDLVNDDFEKLYDAYWVAVIKDGETEITEDSFEMMDESEQRVYEPAKLIAIDENSNLILALSPYYSSGGLGLGGGNIAFQFEKLSGWYDLFLMNTESKELKEFKYTEEDNYYNSDLYNFLMFEYYPEHFDMEEYGNSEELYEKF